LFNYNGLVHGRDLPSTSASDSNTALGKDQQQQDLKERGAEQFRRFSMEDSSTFNQQNRLVDYPFQLEQRIVPSTTCMDYYNYYNHQQKERSSMPNVFIMSNNNTAAAASGSQLSWQQTSLLQKKPTTVASDFTTPTIMSSSISSPLGFKTQTNKKRSMIEQVLDEDYCPSIVSSLSEPIPTTSATSHWMASRKRTKSIRSTDHHHSVAAAATNNMDDNKSNSSSISSSSASQLFTGSPTEYTAPVVDTMIHEQFVMSTAISDPTFYDNDDNKHHNSSNNSSSSSSNSNQILAAMPRRQKLRYDGDHYTPKWVRYTGHLKEGYCDSCHQGKWLQLKNSAYW
jgi:hypothetical protein